MPREVNEILTKAASSVAVPPKRAMMSRTDRVVADLVADPVHDAAGEQGVETQTDGPAQQRTRCNRHAKPNGPVSDAAAVAGPGRSAIRPAPTSRRPRNTKAAAVALDHGDVQAQHPPALPGVWPHL